MFTHAKSGLFKPMSIYGIEYSEIEYLEDGSNDGDDENFIMDDDEVKNAEFQEQLDVNEMEAGMSNNRKRKNLRSNEKGAKKKDREFDDKKKIAEEVSKYPHIFDINNQQFSNKQLQQATWKKIATAVKLPTTTCVNHWNSLKRSAKYYANDRKIECKSGASADEMTSETYRSEWQYRDVMAFYTPPSLRGGSDSIDLMNVRSTTPTSILSENTNDSLLSASTNRNDILILDESGNPIYVSILNFVKVNKFCDFNIHEYN